MAKRPTTQKKDLDLHDEFTGSRINIFLQATAYTIIMIGVMAGGGYLLDQQFGTFPLMFIIGIVAGYPVAQIYIYKKFKKFANKKLQK